MSEFVEQFLIEARELVAQATDDLLALEQSPRDQARLDSAFRAFHTLKGAAGIIEFDPMARVMHLAEDLLAAARSGERPATPGLISDALTALDQLVQWLEDMEQSGEPPGDADAAADALIARLAQDAARPAAPQAETSPWSERLAAAHPELRAGAALRWRPPEDSFFRGRDPLAELADIPGLLAVELSPGAEWPALESFDPYACRLEVRALFAASAETLRGQVGKLEGEAQLVDLAPAQGGLPDLARELLEAQLELLADPAGEPTPGRLGSAAAVTENVLRTLGRTADADGFAQSARTWVADLAVDRLQQEIAALARGGAPSALEGPGELRAAAEPSARALRVDVERIDALVNLTGELAVAKNALGHLAALAAAGAEAETIAALLRAQHAGLDRLVQQLQAQVLNIRVLPMRHVFQRFPKLVREMAAGLGKPARLVIEGEETEADKAVVESLFEPLLHLIRNALDHGIEPPPARAAAGKPATAVIRLAARREGGQVVVEVADDGRGVDLAAVRRRASERGLVDAAAAEAMTEAHVLDLIFAPGFSTAGEVTQLSGRGVGMDAVRTALERLGGRVALESRPGEGARVRLALPFSVLMTSILTVEAGAQTFGIPLDAVLETVRTPADRLNSIGRAKALVHRNRTLPVIRLSEALGVEGQADLKAEVDVVIAVAAGQTFGLAVDRVGERMEVMLKPLEGLMAGAPGLAGATLLGDGRVLLVLDLPELAP